MATTIVGDNTGDDYSGTIDVKIKQNAATTNHDSSDLEVGVWNASDESISLIEFTGLSNITATDIVSDATINVYQTSSTVSITILHRKVLRNWVEAEATWNIWSTGNNWTTAGAQSTGNDISASDGDSATHDGTNNEYKPITSAQLIADIQDYVDGTSSNFGHHFQQGTGGDDNADNKGWRRSEGTDGQRPYITVVHAPAAAGGAHPQLGLMGVGV